MKLYTKEMFLIASEKCEVSIIDAEHIMKYIDEYVTPIELPTDEEVEEYAKQKSEKPIILEISDEQIEEQSGYVYPYKQQLAFIEGAKWYREQLKKKQL